MSGYSQSACENKVYCPVAKPGHCLCNVSKRDLRQKFLDQALVFVRLPDDNRVIHFIQPPFEKADSEYKSHFGWPRKEYPVVPYEPTKSKTRWELLEEKDREKNPCFKRFNKEWSKGGVTERIFEK